MNPTEHGDILHNVEDRRTNSNGSWQIAPLKIEDLTEADLGRTVIYREGTGRAAAGTLSSFRKIEPAAIWARFSAGNTAACCKAVDVVFGVRALSADECAPPDIVDPDDFCRACGGKGYVVVAPGEHDDHCYQCRGTGNRTVLVGGMR